MFFFQAEDGIRDLVRSRGLGDVYKRQIIMYSFAADPNMVDNKDSVAAVFASIFKKDKSFYMDKLNTCLLYTSDAADERSSVDLGGRRIIKKKKQNNTHNTHMTQLKQQTNCGSPQQDTTISAKTKHKRHTSISRE